MATSRIISRPGLQNLGYSLTVPAFVLECDLILWHQGGSTQNPANFRMARNPPAIGGYFTASTSRVASS
jgi:hypothetical protein